MQYYYARLNSILKQTNILPVPSKKNKILPVILKCIKSENYNELLENI